MALKKYNTPSLSNPGVKADHKMWPPAPTSPLVMSTRFGIADKVQVFKNDLTAGKDAKL